jgi:hydroxylamine reductase
MFCYQCEQTATGAGCQTLGVCGKDETTATLHDLLIHVVKGVSVYAHHARLLGAADKRLRVCDPEIDAFVVQGLFATMSNINLEKERLVELIHEAVAMRAAAKFVYERAAGESGMAAVEFGGAASWMPAETLEGLIAQGRTVMLPARILHEGKEIANLQELVLYGVKGVAANAVHVLRMGAGEPEIIGKIHEVLCFLAHGGQSVAELLAMALNVGELNYRVMGVLDKAHTQTFGDPRPTQVRLGARKGKAILVSGHDLYDLYALLVQTKGTGVQVYTHGEMLPAHGYPALKAFAHLAGNYGGAWMDQAEEFDAFPGAVLMTSGCMKQPKESYRKRMFTAGGVNFPEVRHVERAEFGAVIAAALATEGFAEEGGDESIAVGYGHEAVMGVSDKMLAAIKSGEIRRLFLIAGCDGARSSRSYYTELAKAVPEDCMILTLGCGKYRFNKLEFGEVAGLPRLMDLGQCNDAYSAVQVALGLAKALGCGVNELPLSIVLSWYEQKSIAVVLTLLWLGAKDLRVGPTLPAFLSAGMMALLEEEYGLKGIGGVEGDLAEMLC